MCEERERLSNVPIIPGNADLCIEGSIDFLSPRSIRFLIALELVGHLSGPLHDERVALHTPDEAEQVEHPAEEITLWDRLETVMRNQEDVVLRSLLRRTIEMSIQSGGCGLQLDPLAEIRVWVKLKALEWTLQLAVDIATRSNLLNQVRPLGGRASATRDSACNAGDHS